MVDLERLGLTEREWEALVRLAQELGQDKALEVYHKIQEIKDARVIPLRNPPK